MLFLLSTDEVNTGYRYMKIINFKYLIINNLFLLESVFGRVFTQTD